MKWFIRAAGVLSLFTAMLHLIGGQMSLVNPLLDSGLSDQVKTEWLGAWHLISVVLLLFSYYILKHGTSSKIEHIHTIKNIGWINFLFAIVFISVSLYQGILAPQFTLFIVIGVLIWMFQKKSINLLAR